MELNRIGRFDTVLARVREHDARVAAWARRRGRIAVGLHELLWFGAKQAWACLFGGAMVALLIATWRWYPHDAALARYDFLTLSAIGIQIVLIGFRLESRREAAAIGLFHIVGTAMEVFKTSVGSWTYPEASLLRIGGVPLFTGFMYACVGSYIARAWRLFDFRFERHPSLAACLMLSLAIYVNFFTHHYLPDARIVLFVALVLLFGRTWIHFRVRDAYHRMPLLLGFVLVAAFIWLAENAGTFAHAWQYPNQRHGWTLVPPTKLGAWLLLMILSYSMVAMLYRRGLQANCHWPRARLGATLSHPVAFSKTSPACSQNPARLPATTPSFPPRLRPNESARKTTSS